MAVRIYFEQPLLANVGSCELIVQGVCLVQRVEI